MPCSTPSTRLTSVRGLAIAALALCACAQTAPSARSLHYVDGELVSSRPPPPQAYEAYLMARIALDAEPPDYETALRHLRRAQRSDPQDPHLWATRAQAEALAGDPAQARLSAERALSISPGYPLAQRVLAQVDGGAQTAALDSEQATAAP